MSQITWFIPEVRRRVDVNVFLMTLKYSILWLSNTPHSSFFFYLSCPCISFHLLPWQLCLIMLYPVYERTPPSLSPFPPPHQPIFWRGSHTLPSICLSSAVLSPFFVPPFNPATNTQKYTPTHSSHSPPPAHLLNYSCDHVMSLAISVKHHQKVHPSDQHVDLGTVVTGWMAEGVWYNTCVGPGCNHF